MTQTDWEWMHDAGISVYQSIRHRMSILPHGHPVEFRGLRSKALDSQRRFVTSAVMSHFSVSVGSKIVQDGFRDGR